MHRLPAVRRHQPKTQLLVIQTIYDMKRVIFSFLLFARFLPAGAQVEEQVYVHTDKEFYLAGEIVWFKLYVVDAASHRPVDLSKIAYAEVISGDQHPALQAKISLEDGLGNGSFQLPFSMHSGNYIFRAYTRWMMNAGPESYFEKTITIVNTLRNEEVPSPVVHSGNEAPAYDIRVADRSGSGRSCKGSLISAGGDTIARFQSLRFGMGRFSFIPAAGAPCKAVFELDDHTLITHSLPPAEEKGYTMLVTAGDAGMLSISIHSNVPGDDSIVRLYIHNHGSLSAVDQKSIDGGEAQFIVDEKKLPEGVAVFTVLTGKQRPVGERLWFRRPVSRYIDIHTDREQYKPREKVTLQFAEPDSSALPPVLNASMAVVLQDSLPCTGQEDILNYLFLSADLKGAIDSPAYYFSSGTAEVKETTDLLMMTQGWRKLWQEIRGSRHKPEYAGLLVTGKVTDRHTDSPASGVFVWLSVPGQKFRLASAVSNKDGELQWDLGMVYGAHELVVQTGDSLLDRRYRIDLLNPFANPSTQKTPLPFKWPTTLEHQLLMHSIGAQAQNAYQPDRQRHFSQPIIIDTLAFYGNPGKAYRLDDYTRFTTMEEVMREYIREVRVRNSRGNIGFYVQADQANELFFDSRPLILVDGVPVSNVNDIIRFDPLKFNKIEIVAKRYLLADSLFTGIINYSTYKGDLAGFPLDKEAYILDYEGLQLHREFYSPVYDTRDRQTSRIPDLRNVLYWSPDITTSPSGKGEVSFYTSDIPGVYTAIIQGITVTGRAVSARVKFTVDRTSPVK
jgi:hypothetical protein